MIAINDQLNQSQQQGVTVTPVPVLNFMDFIDIDGDLLSTSSIGVAIVYRKRHDYVLGVIRSLAQQLPAKFSAAHLVAVPGFDAHGATSVEFRISQDGFLLLAGAFGGNRALLCAMAYIDAFKARAAYIKLRLEGVHYCPFSSYSNGQGTRERCACRRQVAVNRSSLQDQAANPPRIPDHDD